MNFRSPFFRCLLLLAGIALHAESVSSSFTVPFIDGDDSCLVSGLRFSGNELAEASWSDLLARGPVTGRFSLARVQVTPGKFVFGGSFLQTPALSSGISLDALAVPLLSAGFRNRVDRFTISTSVHTLFIPGTEIEIRSQPVTVSPDPGFGFSGRIGAGPFSLGAGWGFGSGTVSIGGTGVGRLDGKGGYLAAGWKDFGLFFASVDASLAAEAYALLTGSVGFSGEASGLADIDLFGSWGRFRCGTRCLSFDLRYLLGVTLTHGSELQYAYRMNGEGESWLWRFDRNLSPFLVSHVSADWQFARDWNLSLGRWIVILPGAGRSAGTDGTQERDNGSGNSLTDQLMVRISSVDPLSALLAGTGVSVRWNFPEKNVRKN